MPIKGSHRTTLLTVLHTQNNYMTTLRNMLRMGPDECVRSSPAALLRNIPRKAHRIAIVDISVGFQTGIIGESDVVSPQKGDARVDIHVLADAGEDMRTEHCAEAEAKPEIMPQGRAVELEPKPDQRLHRGEEVRVERIAAARRHLAGQRYVAGIEVLLHYIERKIRILGGRRTSPVGLTENQHVQLIAHDLRAAIASGVAGKLIIQMGKPAAKGSFAFGCGLRCIRLVVH